MAKPDILRIGIVPPMPEDRDRKSPDLDWRLCGDQAKARRESPSDAARQGDQRIRSRDRSKAGRPRTTRRARRMSSCLLSTIPRISPAGETRTWSAAQYCSIEVSGACGRAPGRSTTRKPSSHRRLIAIENDYASCHFHQDIFRHAREVHQMRILAAVSDWRCCALGDQLSGGDPFAMYHVQARTDNDGNASQRQRIREIAEY